MAKYVIDTHTLVWFLSDDKKLGPEARKALCDAKSQFYVLPYVFEEIRQKYEIFKKGTSAKQTIKLPPIICYLIADKCKNVMIYRLDAAEINTRMTKIDELKRIKKDDLPFAIMYLILKEKHPNTEVKIITQDDLLRKHPLMRTCW